MNRFQHLMQRADERVHQMVHTEQNNIRYAVYALCIGCILAILYWVLPEIKMALKHWPVTLGIVVMLSVKVWSVKRRRRSQLSEHMLIAIGLLEAKGGHWPKMALLGELTQKLGGDDAICCVNALQMQGLVFVDAQNVCHVRK